MAYANGLATIYLARYPGRDSGQNCGDASPESWAAYAIVAGRTPDDLTGTQFLADSAGWLRAIWRLGDPPGWTARQALPLKLRDILSHPIAGQDQAHHH